MTKLVPVLGDDEEQGSPEGSPLATPSEETLSPKAMLSRDFMPLLTRSSFGI